MKKEAIESIRKERDLLRAVINNIPDCHIFLKDRESRFIITNNYQLKILGLSSLDEIVGKSDFDFFPQELAEKFYRDEQEIVKTGVPLINCEEKTVDKEHREYWLLTTKIPIFSVEGEIAGMSTAIGRKKSVVGILGLSRDITALKQLQQEREKIIKELQNALDKIKVLSGLIPICSVCKKIRDDKGYWQKVEVYVHEHSDADFTHGYCPECAKKVMEEINSTSSKPHRPI